MESWRRSLRSIRLERASPMCSATDSANACVDSVAPHDMQEADRLPDGGKRDAERRRTLWLVGMRAGQVGAGVHHGVRLAPPQRPAVLRLEGVSCRCRGAPTAPPRRTGPWTARGETGDPRFREGAAGRAGTRWRMPRLSSGTSGARRQPGSGAGSAGSSRSAAPPVPSAWSATRQAPFPGLHAWRSPWPAPACARRPGIRSAGSGGASPRR